MQNRRTYEITFWLKTNDEGALDESGLQRIASAVEDSPQGKVLFSSRPVRKRLAWPISHQRDGYFGYFSVELEPETAASFRKKFEHDESILQLNLTAAKTKRTTSFRPLRPRPTPTLRSAPSKEAEVTIEELDKKLEEILKT
jgi:ribosomal protein S6